MKFKELEMLLSIMFFILVIVFLVITSIKSSAKIHDLTQELILEKSSCAIKR